MFVSVSVVLETCTFIFVSVRSVLQANLKAEHFGVCLKTPFCKFVHSVTGLQACIHDL